MTKTTTKTTVKLVNVCPVLISENISRTVDFYVEKLGFKYAKHYDKTDNFATLYRDSIELIIVQSHKGNVESNTKRHGAGYDLYIDPDTVDGVDILYAEFSSNGVKVVEAPRITDYGSYEFVIEDIDSRLLGIGRICSNESFFKNSNYVEA